MASSSMTSPAAAQSPAQYGGSAVNVANFVSTKLSRDNYNSWKVCLVESQGLVGFIDGKAPPPLNDDVDYVEWRRTDWLLKGWILGALSHEVLQNVVNLDSARVVWLELENKYSKSKRTPPPRAAEQEEDWHQHLALYRAAAIGDWDTANVILDRNPDAVKARVPFALQTTLHIAIRAGNSTSFVSKLVDLMSDSSLGITDVDGHNPLHVAAQTGNLHAAKTLVKRLPNLLYVSNHYKMFPVHLAAAGDHRQTIDFLISHTRDNLPTNPFAAESGVMLLTFLINADFFDLALDLVDKYPDLATMGESPKTALERIALKDKAFLVAAQLNFWERLIYPYVQVEMESQVQVPTPQSFDIENQTCCPLVPAGGKCSILLSIHT